MNIKRKVIKIEIENKDYDFVLDFESAIEFQEIYGKSIFVGLNKLSEEQDFKALACLIASCLKDTDTNKPVGMEFVSKIDLMVGMQYFMEKIFFLVENSLPTENDENKKK